jgi:ribosomal protein S18 acetylase RimI-like enzyme
MATDVVFVDLAAEHVPAVAALHRESLAGDFLPSLGQRFLEVLYTGMLDLALGWGVVALDGQSPVGFVLATPDSRLLFRRLIRRRALPLALAVGRSLLRSPSLVRPTLETFLYPSREGHEGPPAELLVIAVRGERRGDGVGAGLVRRLDEAMASRGVSSYKVTVLGRNEGANRFYRRNGFESAAAFTMYGQTWNLYRKTHV